MPLSSQDYWTLRAIRDFAKVVNATEDFIFSQLSQRYMKTAEGIQKDISVFYKRYSDKNGLTLQEAKKRLTAVELSEEDLKLKSRITRLELIFGQINERVERLYNDASGDVHRFLHKTYEDGYYRALEYAGDTAYGRDLALLNVRAVDNAILQNWSGKNFSERIWGHREKFSIELRDILVNGLIRGSSINQMYRLVSQRMNVKLSDANRLVRTESNYAFNKGTIDGYIESGIVDKYQYLATLDNRTSEICQDLDGKDISVK